MNKASANARTPGHEAVREAARHARECGISVVPPVQDGSKRPSTVRVEGKPTWEPFQRELASEEQLSLWFDRRMMTGLGFVCGSVSGGLELFDFDHRGTYERFRELAVAAGLGPLVERIEAGYLEDTPGDGVHWFYYCDEVRDSTKLARRHKTPKEWTDVDRESIERARAAGQELRPVKSLIETKGEHGYAVVAPSFGKVHPSGNPYRLLRGGVATIATLTGEERDAIWELARSFDEMKPAPAATSPPARDGTAGIPPWEDFNARATWAEILEPHGWTNVYTRGGTTYWRRPGKQQGVSASTNHGGHDCLFVFTSSTVLEAEKGYDKVGAYVRLDHGGDFAAAARSLLEKGYGERRVRKSDHAATADVSPARNGKVERNGEAPPFADFADEDLGIVPLATVECRPVRWLWKYRLSMGGLAMMAGDGGIGKSQVLLWMGAAVSTNGPWADGSGLAPLGDVVIVSAEDRPDDTIKPRLLAMGADITRITIVKAKYVIRKPNRPPVVSPTSFQDIGYWQEIFRRRPACRLFIADPVPSFLGRGVNDSKNIEIRNILEPFLDQVIAPADICMIGNTHLNKSVDAKTPMHRISGSIAYGNLPRNVHFVVRDPDDPMRRYLKQAKCNNAPDDLPGLAFRVEKREIVNDEGETIETAVPVFEEETVSIDLAEAVNGTRKGPGTKRGPSPARSIAAAEWLFDFLVERPTPTPLGAIFDAAGEAGLIGHKKDDGKWSSGRLMYDARARLSELPPPRHGLEVRDRMLSFRPGGKEYVHWSLAVKGSAEEAHDDPAS